MYQRIASIFESLLQLLLPTPVPSRPAAPVPARRGDNVPAAAPRLISPMAGEGEYLRGEDTALVRPYLVAHEQRRRRRVLWFAVRGVDLDLRAVHRTPAVAR